LLIESVPGKFVGRAFGLQRALDTVGAVAGVGIALVLIQYLAYSQIFFVAFIPGVASILVVLVLVKDVKRKVAAAKPSSFRASLGGLPSNFRLFLVPVALFGVANFSNVLFTLRAQEVLQLQIGLKMADFYAILLYLILNVVYALTSYTSGFISDKISKRNILALGYAFFAFACFASIFEAANFPILIIIFVLAGVSVGIVDPLEGSFASEMLAGSQLGSGYGVLQTVNGVGDFCFKHNDWGPVDRSVSCSWFCCCQWDSNARNDHAFELSREK
jgi:MFS family permease